MTTNLKDLRAKSHLPAKQAGGTTVADFFDAHKASIQAVLPQHMSTDRMLKLVLGAIRTTPKLRECTVESLFGAAIQCAQLGLEPNTPLGHAYLIPFGNKRQNRTDVQVIFGYRGLIDLARRSGQIVSIAAHAVHLNDDFRYAYGLDEELHHIPAAEEDPGPVTHYYAVAKLVGGGHAFEVLSNAQVLKIRDDSIGYQMAKRYNKPSVWDTHPEEMGRKTAIRRLFKYLPVSIETATASVLDAKATMGEDQHMDDVLKGEFSVVDEPLADMEQEEEAQEQEETQDEEQAQTWPKWKKLETGEGVWEDSTGNWYDPEKHVFDEKAQHPKTNRDGTFTKKRHRTAKSEQTKQVPEQTSEPANPFGDVE